MSIQKDLEQLKTIYLADDIDSDDYQDNLEKINEWEREIKQSEGYIEWQNSDVTQRLLQQAKDSFKTISMKLAEDRDITQAQRDSLFAKKDALMHMVSLIEKDPESTILNIHNEIKAALKV